MSKDSYFFKHDSNARNDEKIIKLRMQHGWKGYGLYWAIIEKLRESTCYKLSIDYNLLSFDLRCENGLIKSIINDFGLFDFTDNGECFYSKSLCERMESLDELRTRRSEAGRIGNEKRWGVTKVSQSDLNAIANGSQVIAIRTEQNRTDKNNINTPLPPFQGEDNEIFHNFKKLWDSFKGRKTSIQKDYSKFQIKTNGLNVDFDELMKRVDTGRDVYFQTWLNHVFPNATTRFIKPTVEEIAAYCKERNNSVNAQQFYDFYESKGWKVGNTPMKDWMAAVRTWERTENRYGNPVNPKTNRQKITDKSEEEELSEYQ